MALHMNVKEFSFSLPRPSGRIPLRTLNFLSQVKFDGEGEIVVVNHVHQFFMKCKYCNIITDKEICRLFTLTFEGRINSWYEAFPTKSIHSWMVRIMYRFQLADISSKEEIKETFEYILSQSINEDV